MPPRMASSVFDSAAFFAAMDERRQLEGLSWTRLAAVIWEQSRELNERLHWVSSRRNQQPPVSTPAGGCFMG